MNNWQVAQPSLSSSDDDDNDGGVGECLLSSSLLSSETWVG